MSFWLGEDETYVAAPTGPGAVGGRGAGREDAERQRKWRREAALGRTDAGSPGDVDLPDSGLGEAVLAGNAARPGDADYKAPLPKPGHGLPRPRGSKAAPRTRTRTAPAASGGQPRGVGDQGGQFISKQGGGSTSAEASAVHAHLRPASPSGIGASIRAFQARHGLKVDGVVGEQTALAIRGRFHTARATAPGAMSAQTSALLRSAPVRPVAASAPVVRSAVSPSPVVRATVPRAGAAPRAGRPVVPRGSGGMIVAGDDQAFVGEPLLAGLALLERAVVVTFDEHLHPRDFHGRFREKLGKLTPRGQAGPDAVSLPDGTRVTIDRSGMVAVNRNGRILRHVTKDAAARDALDRSARGREPESLGGARRYSGYTELVAHGGTADTSPGTGSTPPRAEGGNVNWDAISADRLMVHVRQGRPAAQAALERRFPLVQPSELRGGDRLLHPSGAGDGRPGFARILSVNTRGGRVEVAFDNAANGRTLSPSSWGTPVRVDRGGPGSVPAAARVETTSDPLPAGTQAPTGPFHGEEGTGEIRQRVLGMPDGGRVEFAVPGTGLGAVERHGSEFTISVNGQSGSPTTRETATRALSMLRVTPAAGDYVTTDTPSGGAETVTMRRSRHRRTEGRSPQADTGTDAPALPAIQPGTATPGEITVRGHILGTDATLHLRPILDNEGNVGGWQSRDPVGLSRTATGQRLYPRHLRFERATGDQSTMANRTPQVEVNGERFIMRRSDVARNRPARINGLHTLAGGAPDIRGMGRSAWDRNFTNEPMRPGAGLDAPGGIVPGSQQETGATSAASAVHRRLSQMTNADLSGSFQRFSSVSTEGSLTFATGNDGREWRINHDEVARGNINDSTVQVVSSGAHYTAPSMGRALIAHNAGVGTFSGRSTSEQVGRMPNVRPLRGPAGGEAPVSLPASAGSPAQAATAAQTAARSPRAGVDVGAVPSAGSPRVQQVINKLHGFSADGYTCKITGASATGFSGSILSPRGQRVGSFSRAVQANDQIYHSIFTIDEAHRDSGFGSKLINRMFDSYKDAGFKHVKVSAGLDVGGYQWAKMGFDLYDSSIQEEGFAGNGKALRFVEARSRRVPEAQRPALKALADELDRQVDTEGIRTMNQLSAFGHRFSWTEERGGKQIRMHLGKMLLLGQGWSGKYDLSKHVSGQAIRA